MCRSFLKKAGSFAIICMFAISSICVNHVSASVGKAVEIDSASKAKIVSFLAGKGYENFKIVSGKKSPVGNGYFFAVEGVDQKNKKEYYVELVCTPEYTDWAMLYIEDKAAPKKKQ